MARSKVQDFLDSLKEVTSSDVLQAILAGLTSERISRDSIVFQETVYNLSKNHPILKRFRFNTSGIHPYSEELERVIYRLECSHALGALNPSYTCYQIDKIKLSESLKKFSDDEISEIQEISRKLEECITVSACEH